MNARPERFAPIPNRAAADSRLTGLHFRVLTAIAMHARFGGNGLGCTLSSRRLAAKVGAPYNKVAVARRQLVEWGLLEERPHPSRKQMFMHFVCFDPEADAAMLSKTGPSEGTGWDGEPVPPGGPDDPETGPSEGTTEDTHLKGERRYSSEEERRYSPEGASSKADAINGLSSSPSGSGVCFTPSVQDFFKRASIARRAVKRGDYDPAAMIAELEALADEAEELGVSTGTGLGESFLSEAEDIRWRLGMDAA